MFSCKIARKHPAAQEIFTHFFNTTMFYPCIYTVFCQHYRQRPCRNRAFPPLGVLDGYFAKNLFYYDGKTPSCKLAFFRKRSRKTATPFCFWILLTPGGGATAQGIGGVRGHHRWPCSHGAWPQSGQALGPERESAEPRKARFSAQPKMRPYFCEAGYDFGLVTPNTGMSPF
jgi:hypothetical protein